MPNDTEKDKRQNRSFKIKRDIESPSKHHTSSLETHLKDLALETVAEKSNEAKACQQSPDDPNLEGLERKFSYSKEEQLKRQRVQFCYYILQLIKPLSIYKCIY